jgi:Na+-transporting NADH:ubiquinone oxidoreductase subunit F
MAVEIPRELFSVRRFSGTCTGKRPLTADILELRIELSEPKAIEFLAGQYVQLESEEYRGRDSVIRAYSISSPPSSAGHIELVIRRVPDGICTTWVFDHLRENQPVRFSGPYGEFHIRDTAAPVLFIAGGSGMAPIWSMLRDMEEKGNTRPAAYFFGALTREDLFYAEELYAFSARNAWFTFVPALSKEPDSSGWDGERGLITEVLARHFPDCSHHEAYLCGSPGMIDACVNVLKKGGMPENNIFYDKFA